MDDQRVICYLSEARFFERQTVHISMDFVHSVNILSISENPVNSARLKKKHIADENTCLHLYDVGCRGWSI